MQSRTKINIAIIAIIALVILWMIPATIDVPAKSLNQEDDRGSEIKPLVELANAKLSRIRCV